MSLILTGYIGDTFICFNLIHSTETADTLIKSAEFPADAYTHDIVLSIQEFLLDTHIPEIAVLGISGVAKQNSLIASSEHSSCFEASMIMEQLGICKVFILNSTEASAYGIFSLEKSEYKDLNKGSAQAHGPIVCVSIGNELEMCYCIHNNRDYEVHTSEGGGQDYSPKTKEDKKLYEFIVNKHNRHGLTYESLISGSKAFEIYQYLRTENSGKIAQKFDEEFMAGGGEQTKIMMKAGFARENELAVKAVKIWQKIIGNMLGNLFLNFLPTGGIYLFGEVVRENFEGISLGREIREGYFSGRAKILHDSMKAVPIYLVKSEDLALKGALVYAKSKLYKS